jgi:hypothetical protein
VYYCRGRSRGNISARRGGPGSSWLQHCFSQFISLGREQKHSFPTSKFRRIWITVYFLEGCYGQKFISGSEGFKLARSLARAPLYRGQGKKQHVSIGANDAGNHESRGKPAFQNAYSIIRRECGPTQPSYRIENLMSSVSNFVLVPSYRWSWEYESYSYLASVGSSDACCQCNVFE